MAKHIFVVITKPTPGQEDEFNRWYTEEHLDDVLRVPGFVAAQRFKLSSDVPNNLSGQYLAIYEMDVDDPQTAINALGEAVNAGKMALSSAMDPVNLTALAFTPITARKVRKP